MLNFILSLYKKETLRGSQQLFLLFLLYLTVAPLFSRAYFRLDFFLCEKEFDDFHLIFILSKHNQIIFPERNKQSRITKNQSKKCYFYNLWKQSQYNSFVFLLNNVFKLLFKVSFARSYWILRNYSVKTINNRIIFRQRWVRRGLCLSNPLYWENVRL